MPIKPDGAFITVGGNTLFISDVKKSYVTEPFDRLEFSHERLRSAPNKLGQKALVVSLLGNTPAQIIIKDVSFDDIVPLYPDVLQIGSDSPLIKKKFGIIRYEIQGAPSNSTEVENVLNISQGHISNLVAFQTHIQKAGSMETEYKVLLDLQLVTFSYLTATGITMSGNSTGTVSNCLITSFSPSIEYEEIIDELDNVRLLKSYSMVIEQRTISSAETVV